MTPFYFGTPGRRLFGIYEPAAQGSAGRRAAVLCNPWGSEYIYAHRSLRQLAVRLAACGIHTLRFDFYGTGDSDGEMADADLRGWEDDIELAIEEVQDMAGVRRVALAGLRLGATLAARVASRRGPDIEALALWNPIISGIAYARELEAAALEPVAAARAASGAVLAVKGFPLNAHMRGEIEAIGLAALLAAPATRTLLLITDRDRGQAPPPAGPDGRLETAYLGTVSPWIEDPDNMGAVPAAAIQRIADWLG
jgi:alpha-beta hydrolase superfamily lysophospholipase